jgi:hypothetical protein
MHYHVVPFTGFMIGIIEYQNQFNRQNWKDHTLEVLPHRVLLSTLVHLTTPELIRNKAFSGCEGTEN